jgi:hypothetical protein
MTHIAVVGQLNPDTRLCVARVCWIAPQLYPSTVTLIDLFTEEVLPCGFATKDQL